jgi:hypothetical protein
MASSDFSMSLFPEGDVYISLTLAVDIMGDHAVCPRSRDESPGAVHGSLLPRSVRGGSVARNAASAVLLVPAGRDGAPHCAGDGVGEFQHRY